MRNTWKRLDQPKFGLADRISDAIVALEWEEPGSILNVRHSGELIVACDFGGSHKGALFEAYGFLVGAVAESSRWMRERTGVRRRLLPDPRRMAYKGLNDKLRRRALLPFLDASDAFPGNLFIFMISKRISTLFGAPGTKGFLPELIVAERDWKQKSFRRLLLAASLGALLIAGLSGGAQDILWVSDQDEIAPNPKRHDDAGHVIHHCISTYAPDHCGVLTFVTTEADFDNNRLEDLVAVVDLAAGALVDAFSIDKRVSSRTIWAPLGSEAPEKARSVLGWFANDSPRLRRFVVVLDQPEHAIEVRVFKPVKVGGHGPFMLR